jgi:argonaute-like protein implicated in RNA metabolism and viral defense
MHITKRTKLGNYYTFGFTHSLTTSINNAHIKWKNTKNTPETISSTIFGSVAILQTLGVKYLVQWTLRHYDIVIGECPLVGMKTVKGQAGILSGS